MSFIRALQPFEVEFSLTVEPQEGPYKGDLEEPCLRDVRCDKASGNEWAWCTAVVTAQWGNYKGEATLGGCSYKSADDFQNDPIYDDMCMEAMSDLQATLMAAADRLGPLVTMERVEAWIVEQVHRE